MGQLGLCLLYMTRAIGFDILTKAPSHVYSVIVNPTTRLVVTLFPTGQLAALTRVYARAVSGTLSKNLNNKLAGAVRCDDDLRFFSSFDG
jgi:hypothetical protein